MLFILENIIVTAKVQGHNTNRYGCVKNTLSDIEHLI